MYLLPKIHKDRKVWPGQGKVPPDRPIIADCGSESYASAEYIDHFLAPLAKHHKSYLKDTKDLINKIAEIKAKEGAFIATIDVDSLYTNIDITNGLEAVKQIFNKNPDPNGPDKEILELLKIYLENNDFKFNSQWYLQTWGTSMGKKFAPNYANLLLAEWEEKALEKCVLKPSVYWRFLDDIFMIWEHSKEEFYKLVKILYTHHPSITVTAELSSESMHFIDTVVYKGKDLRRQVHFDTNVYFKPTDTLELLHKRSHHPNHTFKGFIKSQILRYVRICNNKQDVMIACRKLFAALVRRGYSERFLQKIKDKTLRVLYLEVLNNIGDITLNKFGRLEAERKWQLALKTYPPFGLNTVPSPKNSGVTPFVITYSATAVEAAKLVKTSFNKLKAKHPNILYKRCVTAFKRGQKLRDLLVRSRLGKSPLDNPTVTGSDSCQDLTTLVNALDEV